MKKVMVLLFGLFTLTASAQMQNGSKVFTTSASNFSINFNSGKATSNGVPTVGGRGSGIRMNPEFSIGTIKNNSLFAYGLSLYLGYFNQHATNNQFMYGIAPIAIYQKFYPLGNKLFYSPFSRASIGYERTTFDALSTTSTSIQESIVGSVGVYPFSITFQKNTKTNFLFTLSRIGVNYAHTKSYFKPTLNNSKTISTNVDFTGNINNVGFGIQKIF